MSKGIFPAPAESHGVSHSTPVQCICSSLRARLEKLVVSFGEGACSITDLTLGQNFKSVMMSLSITLKHDDNSCKVSNPSTSVVLCSNTSDQCKQRDSVIM